jgi:superfamily I DNA/RNA helicase
VEAFTAELRTADVSTHLHLCVEATRLLGGSNLRRYGFDHVVVDEAQDLHPAQWRVQRAAVLDGPDDLFITGDPHQRIYDSKVSLGSLGISVTGRSGRLRINYRSTAEILGWSTGLLDGSLVEDLGGEGSDSLTGYRSLLHGKRPHTAGFQTEQDEVTADRVKDWLGHGVRVWRYRSWQWSK